MRKKIYATYYIGEVNGKDKYSEPIELYVQTEDIKSLVMRGGFGVVNDYDRYILVPIGENTRYINEQSLLWVDVEPNTDFTNMDYKIERKGDAIDGLFTLYCNSLTTDTKSLYYEQDGLIYKVKVDLDSDSLTAIIPFDKYLPITETTKIWLTKPTDAESTTNIIKLIKKEELPKGTKLTFAKVVA
jgi:hypothetical protein